MFTTGVAGAALLKVFAPLLEALFNAFGKSFNDYLSQKRAEQTQKDLGRVTAERDQAVHAQATTQAELEAAVNAPKTVDDAIKRLEEGSA